MRPLVGVWLAFLQVVPAHADLLQVGTTYSPKQSAYLELDWRETYLEILTLEPAVLRLGAYWSEIEQAPDVYDFRALDWQIAQARTRGIPVILTVGMKAPRWPEYFIPDWILRRVRLRFGADVSRHADVTERTLKFLREVVRHYEHEGAIRYWQVENEPLDRAGPGQWWISQAFLAQEVALVRTLDSVKRPVIINVATFPNRWLSFMARFFSRHDPVRESLALCDILALNLYPVIGQRVGWFNVYFGTSRNRRERYVRDLLRLATDHGKPVWITELQAEPWEPGQLVHTVQARPRTGWPQATRRSFEECRALRFTPPHGRGAGFTTILLWGAEYWHFRKVRYDDRDWWEMARELFTRNSS